MGLLSSGADASSSGAVLDQTNMGGLSFEITPSNAELFVDNVRVGTRRRVQVDDATARFASGTPPCRDSRCRSTRTISVDVDIIAGQVIPYQGSLER